MRIKEPSAQVGYLLVVVIGVTLTVIPLMVVNFDLGFAWAVVSLIAAVAVAARTFRGREESDAPRPWWKMTSTRAGGIVLSALFLIQGVVTSLGALQSPNPPLVFVGGATWLTVAALYLSSAIRNRAVSP
ncbi:hypothetical protein ACFC14_01040 [Microbacterium sp. NPDC055988]|uniref:hypothetical protein n=1 Tax=Microbacterium sp. NPDC055988 TaxID=3345671 RepID=UPI0035E0FF92